MTPLVKDIIMSSTRMPALFLGHGSPMNVLEDNLYTRSWQKLGMTLPRPQAIVVVSAHWFTRGTGVTAMAPAIWEMNIFIFRIPIVKRLQLGISRQQFLSKKIVQFAL